MKVPLQLVFIAGCVLSASAFAQPTFNWDGAIDGNWSKAGNWSDTMPGSTHTAAFGAATTTLVDITAPNTLVGGLSFTGAFPSYTLKTSGTGTLVLGGGVTVGSGGGPVTFHASLGITLGSAAWSVDSPVTVLGALSGSAGLTKNGTGTLTLSGANTYSGGTTIESGTLVVAGDDGLGTAPVSAQPANLTFGNPGGTLQTTASFTLSDNRGITLIPLATGTISTDSGTTLTYGGSITGEVFSFLVKEGDGTLKLTGASPDFAGDVIVNRGTVWVTDNNALGSHSAQVFSNGSLKLEGVALASSVILSLEGAGSGAGALIALGTSSAAGEVRLTGNATIHTPTNSDTLTVSGQVTQDNGEQTLTKTGAGSLTFSGTSGTNFNTLSIQDGTVVIAAPDTLNSDTNINLGPTSSDTSAMLAVNENLMIRDLTGYGMVSIANGRSFTVNLPTDDFVTFDGKLDGTGAFVKNGSQTSGLTLTGDSSDFTGPVYLDSGVITAANATGSATGSGTIFVRGGATLHVGDGHTSGSVAGSIELKGGVVSFSRTDTLTTTPISGDGYVLHSGSGTLKFAGTNTYNGTTGILPSPGNGTIEDANNGAFSPNSSFTLYEGQLKVNFNERIRALGDWSHNSTIAPGTVTIASGATLGIAGDGYTFSGKITGAGRLQLTGGNGTGRQTLTGTASDYTGGTEIFGGATLVISSDAALGAAGSGLTLSGGTLEVSDSFSLDPARSVTLNGGGTFDVASGKTLTYAGALGSGSWAKLRKAGTGTLLLSGSTTNPLSIGIDAGALQLGGNEVLQPTTDLWLSTPSTTLIVAGTQTLRALGGFGTTDIVGALSIVLPSNLSTAFNGTFVSSGTLNVSAGTNSSFIVTGSSSQFSGAVNLNGGQLIVENSSPLGTGALALAGGTTLSAGKTSASLANASVNIGDNVTLVSGHNPDATLLFSGNVTMTGTGATTLHVDGEAPVMFGGNLAGSAATLTVDGGTPLVLAGTTSGLGGIIANGGAVIFANSAALPGSVSVNSSNGGYLGIGLGLATPPTFSSLVASLPADKSAFNGALGFDSMAAHTAIPVVTDTIDLQDFTNPAFKFGSMTAAIIGPGSTITPPVISGARRYTFGGGSGHLGIAAALTDVSASPAGVLVTSAAGSDPQAVIFRGANTYTGSVSFGGVTAGLVVDRSIAVLDSPLALPTGQTFAFTPNGPAYVGYTEAAGFASFAEFAGRIASGGYSSDSILGVDSHAFFDGKITQGYETKTAAPATVTGVDLSSFSAIYLGSHSDVVIADSIKGPSDGLLRLATVGDGRMEITAPFDACVGSVQIGVPGGSSNEFSTGEIILSGNNTYSGGTTFKSGTLMIAALPWTGQAMNPLGTGDLTIVGGAASVPVLTSPVGRQSSVTNAIVLNGPLQLNRPTGTGGISLSGLVSGSGSLNVYGSVGFVGTNTFTGGIALNDGSSLSAPDATAFGTGTLTARGTNQIVFWSVSPNTISNPVDLSGSLQFGGSSLMDFTGTMTLTGDANIHLRWGPQGMNQIRGPVVGSGTLRFSSDWDTGNGWLISGTNTYSGGTRVDGTRVLFTTAAAIPSAGKLVSTYGLHTKGYIGITYGTNVQTSFLDKFDRTATNGSIGFDSLDVASPTIISEALDLTGFNPSVRLGSSTKAILQGTITPAGADYNFGDGGGTLVVASALTGNRAVNVSSEAQPLTVVLQGTNTYTGGTSSNNSIVRFETAGSLPASGALKASGGYIGISDAANVAVATFLSRFGSAVESVIGFDSANLAAPQVISSAIDLTAYPALDSNTFVGTSTKLILQAPVITAGSELRLAAVGTGSLIVDTAITNGSLRLGTGGLSGRATVVLNQPNSYSDGTQIVNTNVVLHTASGFGLGPVGFTSAGLSTDVGSLTISNSFTGPDNSTLTLSGSNNFTLSNTVRTDMLTKDGSSIVTLSGTNPSLARNVNIQGGRLVFASAEAAGTSSSVANFYLYPDTSVQFANGTYVGSLGAGVANALVDLAGDLTVKGGGGFAGVIQGTGSVTFQNDSTNANTPTLSGTNAYTGGTNIVAGSTLKVISSGALPASGIVTVTGGTLALASQANISFTNSRQLAFNSGRIVAVSNLTFDADLVIGSARTLSPGSMIVRGSSLAEGVFPGKLGMTFNSGSLVFASDGTYEWRIAQAHAVASQLDVNGTVNVTATSAAPFHLAIFSVGADGTQGKLAGFDVHSSYSWTLLTASSIAGIAGASDLAKFDLDTTAFAAQNPDAFGTFSLSNTSTSLILNYTPTAVPEPSTWALLVTGLAGVAVAMRRRRR